MINNVVLVIGEVGAGKSHLCNLLPKEQTLRFRYMSLATAKTLPSFYPNSRIRQIVLINNNNTNLTTLSNVVKELARHYQVYVQLYPKDVHTFLTLLNMKEGGLIH